VKEPTLEQHRSHDENPTAIVFVHGFSGKPETTWGDFLKYVAQEPGLAKWDIYSLGYDSRLAPDFKGLWAADPSIEKLAIFFHTRLTFDPLKRYRALALVAHSMGGLVVQRALVDYEVIRDRTSHVFLFGTPSAGLTKAGRFGFLKKSIKQMAQGGEFITTLRADWSRLFANGRPFAFWTVAGARDEFVPSESSLDPFALEDRLVVIGDHLRIVKPTAADAMSVRVVCDGIIGKAAPGGPWNSALVAIEAKQFQAAVAQLEPNAEKLDDKHLVELALALDKVNRADDAIGYLSARAKGGTDVRGVLAGRLKRRWRANGIDKDGAEAQRLYESGLADAAAADDHAQAFYHAINVAFMELAYRQQPAAARAAADAALEHCARAPEDFWRAATEGDARQHRGEFDAALTAYRRAVALEPEPREVESIYEQAYVLAGLLNRPDVQADIDGVFRPKVDAG
jgi:hypothetical protein